MSRRAALGVLAVVAGLAPGAAHAGAAPPPPSNLRVDGGAEAWHRKTLFEVRWDIPEGLSNVAAVHFRLRSPDEEAIDEARLAGAVEATQISVPSRPGIYSAEVWLEETGGAQGPPSSTQLRYDATPPASVAALPIGEWIGRTAFPLSVRFAHPQSPLPPSGIRGYAVSIDGNPLGSPCASPLFCTPLETDLSGGVEGDSLRIPELPDGTSYVHSVAVSGAGVRSAAAGHTPLRVDKTDPVTRIQNVPTGWSSRAASLTAIAADAASGMAGEAGAFTALRIDGGAPLVAPGDTAHATVIEEGVHTVAYYARDAAGNVNDGATSNGTADHAPGVTTVRIDRTPPGVAFFNSQSPEDPELIRVHVDDPLSGGDSGSIAIRAAGSDGRFRALPTSAGPDRLEARWKSDAYPPGRYEFRAIAFDAAGNARTSFERSNGRRMLLTNPVKSTSVLRAAFGTDRRSYARRPAGRTLAYGEAVRFGGRLSRGWERLPIAAAPVRVVERFQNGAERATTLTTAADGTFSVQLRPGPSREVLASFPGTGSVAAAATAPAPLFVRSGVRLAVSRKVAKVGGRPVVFRGRVLARPGEIPADGTVVELQFRLPGLPWRQFRTVRTDESGRFRYPYRFSDDDSRGVRFRFRAVTTAQEGWPYEPGSSKPVTVRGS